MSTNNKHRTFHRTYCTTTTTTTTNNNDHCDKENPRDDNNDDEDEDLLGIENSSYVTGYDLIKDLPPPEISKPNKKKGQLQRRGVFGRRKARSILRDRKESESPPEENMQLCNVVSQLTTTEIEAHDNDALVSPPPPPAFLRSTSALEFGSPCEEEFCAGPESRASSISHRQKMTGSKNSVRRIFQRSHSLVGSYQRSSSSLFSSFHSSSTSTMSTSSSSALCLEALQEDIQQQQRRQVEEEDVIGEETTSMRECKKIRARRHSMVAALPSTMLQPQPSSLSSDPDLPWLVGHNSTPKLDLSTYLEVHNGESGHSSASPDVTSATSSCRKRSVCGSPILSDPDDWTLSLSSNSRKSRSRIFSPANASCEPFPIVPILASSSSSLFDNKPHHIYENTVRDAMSIGSVSDDDDSTTPNSSPDTSFDMTTASVNRSENHISANPLLVNDGPSPAILETMPSYEELQFLLRELQKLRSHIPCLSFGNNNIWKIAPPVNQWPSQRRAAFTNWAKTYFGFTVRSAGMGFTYIQISKARGMEILAKVEQADAEYGQKIEPTEPVVAPSSLSPSPHADTTLFTSPCTNHIHSSPDIDQKQTFCLNKNINIERTSSIIHEEVASIEDEADFLSKKISSLSMKDIVQPLSRMVTLPPPEQHENQQKLDKRSSIDSVAANSYTRPSLDSHSGSDVDFNVHLYGHSPRVSHKSGKPPKMSIGSICSTTTRGSSTPFANDTASCSNFDFVMTPLTSEPEGWGSRPIAGKDWGSSEACDEIVVGKMLSQFSSDRIIDGDLSGSLELQPLPNLKRLSPCIEFSVQTQDENMENFLTQIENERRLRRCRNTLHKRKRMSLFVNATGTKSLLPQQSFTIPAGIVSDGEEELDAVRVVVKNKKLMGKIFSFFDEETLFTKAFATCSQWSDWATDAHANLLLGSVQIDDNTVKQTCLDRSWTFLHGTYPWACFLAEGGAKKVYKVLNHIVRQEEAVSVMDTYNVDNMQIVANELAVSAMLSSLARRAICPNFIMLRGVFTCAHPPPESHWGNEENKNPNGMCYEQLTLKPPRTPKNPEPGRYQYIRMELVSEGDAEETIKRQCKEVFNPATAQSILFQIAFALYAAADKFSIKHYDVKLLNIFLQNIGGKGDVVLRYGLGSHVFSLRMPSHHAFLAKLADFGTANIGSGSNGQPVTIAHFTTLENTPPDYMILGDEAKQGHEHDNFGLGLCMLHLFTGHRPYEEIMEEVKCPPTLKKKLRSIWENEKVSGYSVIRSVIFDGVDKDDDGHILEGDPDETFYHTLYRFLVLFGIPKAQFQQKRCPKIWKAITESLQPSSSFTATSGKPVRKRSASDATQYNRDCKKFSLKTGNNKYIARARRALDSINGGMDLLFDLCSFDPENRATPLHALNSTFMENLREIPGTSYQGETVLSYGAFCTQT